MRTNASIFAFLITFAAQAINTDQFKEFIVWNVGQGLWTTLVDYGECRHFDMGGEFAPRRQVKELCYGKRNSISLSHEDWDHIGFVKQMARALPFTCIFPTHTSTKRYVRNLLEKLPVCSPDQRVQKLDLDFYKDSNESSRIIETEGILLPGDSTIRMERAWSYLLKNMAAVKILVLGHHGSRTSTSQELLSQLPSLKMSIASAREKRYGHPHSAIRKRLRKNGIPLLRTEDWGHIRIRQ